MTKTQRRKLESLTEAATILVINKKYDTFSYRVMLPNGRTFVYFNHDETFGGVPYRGIGFRTELCSYQTYPFPTHYGLKEGVEAMADYDKRLGNEIVILGVTE